ncbi:MULTISPECIES: copper resistance CopC family protein [Nocardia]|uniref:Copper resistance protein C n=2 Tax=Nocardiaceae TaxID=85025 RepID=U5EIB9_NOCAS|nr:MULTISPECIES: copper resistance CopC family protein [Nocardia]UGT47234.1 copper resistance protein CopC [Nocardia asteroides]GAD87040.1 copper resistance protein C [Nocardia asteroides NBRC 15531]
MVGRTIVVALLAALAVALPVGPASAHSQLDSSIPAAGASVDSPLTMIELTFNQQIGTAFATVGLTDSSGTSWAAQVSKVEGETVRVAVSPTMPPQQYTVAYRVVSDDGHPITGSYDFTYTAAPTASTGVAPADAPSNMGAGTGESSAMSPSSGELPWPLIGILIALVIGGTVVTLRASKRSQR